jgi:cytochrome c oxidase cbb3-type subunit III
MPTKREKDAATGTEILDHEWDGIRELNTPLPKWWLYVLYACILWSFGYYIFYPAWPGLTNYTRGVLGYAQRGEVKAELDALARRRAPVLDRIAKADLAQIRSDPSLLAVAVAGGRVAFADNCAACHGAGGAGAKGFPVLADDDWLWGGKLDAIHQTIAFGVRSAHDKTRQSAMPAFGVDGILQPAQISDVAEFVLSLTRRSRDPAKAERGKALFADNCALCHGDDGGGNQELGAPRLSDGIWLYGGDREAIVQTITQARTGMMPAWVGRLDEATVKMLAVYVHALGGGQ